ncbi:Pentatricopeptide repeat-containing protein At2g31400, partial [Durusdinium trenchii]
MICVGANKALNGDENILTKEAERKRNAAKITFAITRVKRQHWPKALQIWGNAKATQRGIDIDVVTGSATLAAVATVGKWQPCLSLLASFQAAHMQLNAYGYNAGVTSCARAGSWAFGQMLLQSMKNWRIELQNITINALAACLRQSENWQAATECLQRAVTCDVQMNLVGCNTLLSFAQPWPNAFELLRTCHILGLRSDSTTWNSVLTRSQAWRGASLLAKTASQGIELDVITINAGTVGTTRWTDALHIYSLGIRLGIRLDAFSGSSMSSVCASSSQWRFALQLCRAGCVDVVSMCAGSFAWSSAHVWEAASVALIQGLQPDIISFGSVLYACDRGGHWKVALRLLRKMSTSNLKWNTVVCVAAMSACRTASKWRRALGLMSTQPSSASPVLFNALVNACSSSMIWKDSLELCSEAKHKSQLDDIAISCCAASSPWQVAAGLATQMMLEAMSIDEGLYAALIHAYCRAWQWRPAWKLVTQA